MIRRVLFLCAFSVLLALTHRFLIPKPTSRATPQFQAAHSDAIPLILATSEPSRNKVPDLPKMESALPENATTKLGSEFGNAHPSETFDETFAFEDDRAIVKSDGKYGFIDRSGRSIAAPQFDQAWNFSEGFAVVRVEDKFGYIDSSGRLLSAPVFDYAQWFREGLAAVELDSKYGYVAPTGKWAIPPQFERAWSFENGVALVEAQGEQWYIDHAGEFVRKAN